ncbi:MAG TPA: hypothetical protein VM934_11400 [Pyrinomonadaceae bacterium]|nr:hypothetical protein [Pyrinomonadaceae bacterium]
MRLLNTGKLVLGLPLLALALSGAACQDTAVTNTNTTVTTTNVNSANTANVSVTTGTTATGTAVETREPDKYTARITFTAQASGQAQGVEIPMEVARNGNDRRYAINAPAVGRIIFLDRADKRYLILESQKQYAELTPEMTGFDVRSMSLGQMVMQLQKQQGVERVGNETLNGREAIKYRYAGAAKTGSQAGDVKTENFIYIDKDTGLPLRWEGFGQATGNVQGVNSARVVAETRDIKTEADPALFEVPQNMRKLTPEEVRRYMNTLTAFAGMFMNNMNGQGGAAGTGTPPATGPSPSANTSSSPMR